MQYGAIDQSKTGATAFVDAASFADRAPGVPVAMQPQGQNCSMLTSNSLAWTGGLDSRVNYNAES